MSRSTRFGLCSVRRSHGHDWLPGQPDYLPAGRRFPGIRTRLPAGSALAERGATPGHRTRRQSLMRVPTTITPSATSSARFRAVLSAEAAEPAARRDHAVAGRAGVAALAHDVADGPPARGAGRRARRCRRTWRRGPAGCDGPRSSTRAVKGVRRHGDARLRSRNAGAARRPAARRASTVAGWPAGFSVADAYE